MRGDKAAAGFQPPSSSHQRPLILPRHVAPLSHGRFPSLHSEADSVNADFVYGGVLWRFLSLTFSHLYAPRSQPRDLSRERVSIRLASSHRMQSAGSPTTYPSIFSFSPLRLSFSFLLHRSIRRTSGFRFHLSRAQT